MSDLIKTWPLDFCLAPGQSGVKKSRRLAVVVGAAG